MNQVTTDPAVEEGSASGPSWVRIGLTVAVCLAIAVVSAVLVGVIWLTEPEAQKEGAVKRTAMLVETTAVEEGSYTPVLTALGAVRPDQDVQLQPRVSGQVAWISEDFIPGRVVPEGTPLLRIDPADARNALAQRRSELAQAEADLALEKGRQAVARAEREQIEGPVSAEQEALILREPQLQSTEARVLSARAAVRQAELDLERTTVRAPFDALILDRMAHTGSQVSPSVPLGRVVSTDRFWVELTLPVGQVRHLPLVDGQAAGTEVRVHDRSAWGPDEVRRGALTSVVRQVDEQTRLARLLVRVDDPLALQTDGPALVAGGWVEARIDAAELRDVIRLPRALLRRDDTVWEMQEGVLKIREVEVVLEDARHAYIASGLDPGAQVVSTSLATVTEGAPLRTTEAR